MYLQIIYNISVLPCYHLQPAPPKKITSKTSPLTNLSRREVPFAKDATYQGFIDLSMGRFFMIERGHIFLIEEGNSSFIEGGLLEETIVCIFPPLTS